MLSFDQFCELSTGEITERTPASMIFAAGGTRRAAMLAGITDQREYVLWSATQMLKCFSLFANYGIRHIVTHAITPKQWQEDTPEYREALIEMVRLGLTNVEFISELKNRNWHACMIGDSYMSGIKSIAEELNRLSAVDNPSLTIYFTTTSKYTSHWDGMIKAIANGHRTQEEIIEAQYGCAIPPVKLYIGYGKLELSPAICPPSMGAVEGVHCYWLQKPGYVTDQRSVLAILYDYAVTRRTWMRDKSNRTEKVLAYQDEFSQKMILGLGKRLGPFWYPQSIVDPLDND
jgi:hypothetical protein